jgi:hypothetical protein
VTRNDDSGQKPLSPVPKQIGLYPIVFFVVNILAVESLAVASFAIASFLATIICGRFSFLPSGSRRLVPACLDFAFPAPLSDFF